MNHYEKEKVEFESNFIEYKNKRIVLYGIGRFTATLVSLLKGWNIVGLMDRNPERIGSYTYGLPILGLSEVEKKADVIIINTSGTYWDLIYQRIKHVNLPIYFRNGEKAESRIFQYDTEYWNSSYENLKSYIDAYDIISFDFFDTLFNRKLYMPSEIWEYVGEDIDDLSFRKSYLESRKKSYIYLNKKNANIYDIYANLSRNLEEDVNLLLNKEMNLENKFMEPRYTLLSILKYAIERKKEVYIVSDMYLTTDFFTQKLKEYNIILSKNHFWISCECGCTKRSGELWRKFQNQIIKEKRALHIGNDATSDIDNCKNHSKCDTYFIMSKEEMLQKSSIKQCIQYFENDYHSIILGLCLSRLFNNPFALCETKGNVIFNNRKDFGYCILGPIIFSFLYWLTKSVKKDSINQIFFLGRDGYFLKENFEYLSNLSSKNKKININYLETSRQILMLSSIENENDFWGYANIPYEGKLQDYMWDRFEVNLDENYKKSKWYSNISLPDDFEKIKEIILHHKNEIIKNINWTKENYIKYLNYFKFEGNVATVDLGFYGTTQHYLSKLLKKEFVGYYIVANIDDSNVLSQKHILKSCTKITKDRTCKNSYIHSSGLVIESFLTSPHGMLRNISKDGKFGYASNTNNQVFFKDKIEINNGIKEFINDMVQFHYKRLHRFNIYIDNFLDTWYGVLIKNSIFSENIKRSFYNDNSFIHRRQESIFD